MKSDADGAREAGTSASMRIGKDSTDTAAARVPPWLRIPAPIGFAIAFLAGTGLQSLLALPLPPAHWLGALRIAGTVLANTGLLLALVCLFLFARNRTTILPSGSASRLVVRGPYRYSRNPMYLSLVLSYAGIAGMLDLPWALLPLPLPLLLLQYALIPFEEARMRALFGDEYVRYQSRVRRWI